MVVPFGGGRPSSTINPHPPSKFTSSSDPILTRSFTLPKPSPSSTINFGSSSNFVEVQKRSDRLGWLDWYVARAGARARARLARLVHGRVRARVRLARLVRGLG